MRTTLALALALPLLAAQASAAIIILPAGEELADAANYTRVAFAFVDDDHPYNLAVRDYDGAYWSFVELRNENATPPPAPSPSWIVNAWVWVPLADAGFRYQPSFMHVHWAIIELAEFRAAGDASITLMIDPWAAPDTAFETLDVVSPNLGTVERTFVRTPEPAAAALAGLAGTAVFTLGVKASNRAVGRGGRRRRS